MHAFGEAVTVLAALLLATQAIARTSEDTTKPSTCYPVSVHTTVKTLGCPDVAPLNEVFRKWKTGESVDRADQKSIDRMMDKLGKKGCFWFGKDAGPFDAVDADHDNKMVQIVVPWNGRQRKMWVITEALRMDDPKLAAKCATQD
jgi:hypothetical protein